METFFFESHRLTPINTFVFPPQEQLEQFVFPPKTWQFFRQVPGDISTQKMEQKSCWYSTRWAAPYYLQMELQPL